MVQRHIDVFSLRSFCEAVSGQGVMILFYRSSKLALCVTVTSIFNKTTMPEHDCGSWILRPRSFNFERNPDSFSTMLLYYFARILKGTVNMMFSQVIENVNTTVDIE